MDERVQKLLARLGYGSRREIEGWIRAGRVTINGTPAQLGDRVSGHETVALDGRRIAVRRTVERQPRVLLYHKPVGEVCARADPEGRPTIFERLPPLRGGRWVSIGRLDLNSSGLLLLTDDGDLANRLMHPARQIEREYAVRVMGEVDEAMLARLVQGVTLEDGPAAFAAIRAAGGSGANRWYHVVLREGRKREVRRLWESQGVRVSRLIRVRYGATLLPRGLRAGRSTELDEQAVAALLRLVGMAPQEETERARPGAKRTRRRAHQSRGRAR